MSPDNIDDYFHANLLNCMIRRRKIAIQNLRKKGNYLIERPVRNTLHSEAEDYPRIFCWGLYKKSSLRYHMTKCPKNTTKKKCSAQAEGQTFKLTGRFIKDDILHTLIFPKMTKNFRRH